jgi:hypothetical protein
MADDEFDGDEYVKYSYQLFHSCLYYVTVKMRFCFSCAKIYHCIEGIRICHGLL